MVGNKCLQTLANFLAAVLMTSKPRFLSSIDFHFHNFCLEVTVNDVLNSTSAKTISFISVEKRLTGVVCTSSDLRIVPIFCNTKNLCETMSLLQETMHTDKTSCNVFSMTKYLTEMIVWLSLLIVKKSNRHILFKGM